jgi:hypothetical protein
MRRDTQLRTVGGESAHVGDCYIWAEISYLDSPDDYREVLPPAGLSQPMGELVFLDDEPVINRFKKWEKVRALLISALQATVRMF